MNQAQINTDNLTAQGTPAAKSRLEGQLQTLSSEIVRAEDVVSGLIDLRDRITGPQPEPAATANPTDHGEGHLGDLSLNISRLIGTLDRAESLLHELNENV